MKDFNEIYDKIIKDFNSNIISENEEVSSEQTSSKLNEVLSQMSDKDLKLINEGLNRMGYNNRLEKLFTMPEFKAFYEAVKNTYKHTQK